MPRVPYRAGIDAIEITIRMIAGEVGPPVNAAPTARVTWVIIVSENIHSSGRALRR